MILTVGTTWWQMLICLAVALVLSTAIGFERQLKAKSAGMRTHTLVGLGAALFTIVSKYGFADVIAAGVQDHINLDPSRVAAQIVSGIGFIGAGLVFVRRNRVRGLTTAASIWLTAAIGTASGAGLVVPAVFVVLAHYLVAFAYPWLVRRTSLGNRSEHALQASYVDGTGALRSILQACTKQGFQIQGFTTQRDSGAGGAMSRLMKGTERSIRADEVSVELEIEGTGDLDELVHQLSELENVTGVTIEDQTE
ncbi:MgtC/SapB family protein [Arthrobacter sp. JSM 101049]|uniref:MgtC/SapB family protein n=1 Tax=Arthrobacter sp. JSM 101049 TaxID=929097 RepID=UPI00356866E7